MKKNAIAIACAAVLAIALLLPAGLMGKLQPEMAVRDKVTLEVADQSETAAPVAESSVDASVSEQEYAEVATIEEEYVPGDVLVGIADDVTVDQVNEQLASLDYIATKAISEEDISYGFVKLQLSEGVSVETALSKLKSVDFATGAQPNYVYHVLDGWDDEDTEEYTSALQAVGSSEIQNSMTAQSAEDDNVARQWMLGAINAQAAWNNVTGTENVTVAVLDSGVNVNHPDFKKGTTSNIVGSYSVLNKNTTVTDTYGHGTHVAGIISAYAGNDIGVQGVSHNAKIMPVQVIKSNGDVTSEDAAKGLDYVVGHKADYNVKVVNMSFGGARSILSEEYEDYVLLEALGRAHSADLLVVCAAGNNGTNRYNCFPVDYDPQMLGVINVYKANGSPTGALVRNDGYHWTTSANFAGGRDQRASDASNYNFGGQMNKEISAPGTSIYSTTKDGGYGDMTGTSMATPCVSGVAALVYAKSGNAGINLNATQVKDLLCSTATDIGDAGFEAETGYGVVNAEAAVEAAGTGERIVVNNSTTFAGNDAIFVNSVLNLSVVGSNDTWTWSSSSNHIYVSNSSAGTIVGKSAGQATITATSSSGKKLVRTFTVYNVSMTGATNMGVGSSTTFAMTTLPTPAPAWTWSSDQPDVVSIDSHTGEATAKRASSSQVKITASLAANPAVKVIAKVNVINASVSGANTVQMGNKLQLSVTGASDNIKWSWSSSNKGVATVNSSGQVSPVSPGETTITVKSIETVLYSITLNKTVKVTAPISACTITTSTNSLTYTGGKRVPSVSVSYGGTSLKSTDYTVTYLDSQGRSVSTPTAVGTYTIVVTGKGYYTGSNSSKKFSITGQIASVTPSPASYSYTGSAIKPTSITVKGSDGKSLTTNDYSVVGYYNNVNAGKKTAYVTVRGKGNYTGRANGFYSIVKSSITWNRIWGQTALDTMKAIVDAGKWSTGGTVVLVTNGSYYDGLTANGVAGLAGAPIVLTNGQSLSSQSRAVISSLKPKTIVVCGGNVAVTDGVVSAARSAAGTSPRVVRLWGQHADDTAVAIYQQGLSVAGGSWSTTAFVCTDKGYWDALSAAPISYTKHMPIFLTTGNGARLSNSTLTAMKNGKFKSVYIVGGSAAVSDTVISQLKSAGIPVSGRIWGAHAVDTSYEVAKFGKNQGMSVANMGIATTNGYSDALAGAALCGRKNSVLVLVDGPSATSISNFVRPNSSSIISGYVFGGTIAISAATYNALPR